MKILILIVLAASYIGFRADRKTHSPTMQSFAASVYCIIAMTVVFGGLFK